MMGFNYDDCDRGMEFTRVQQNSAAWRFAAGVVAGDLLTDQRSADHLCGRFYCLPDEHPFDGSDVTLEYEHSGKTRLR